MRSRRVFFLQFSLSIPILLCLSACSGGKADKTKAASLAEKALPVRVINVEAQQVRRTVESVGTLFAYDEVPISA